MSTTTSRRKFGLITIVTLVVVVWLAVMIWLALQPQSTEGNLGIADETNHGAAAITSVLQDQGVAVRPAQSTTQLRSELQRDPDAIVLFHDKNSAMQTASYERLDELAELVPAQQRVFAGVSDPQQQHLLDGVYATQPVAGVTGQLNVEDSCTLEAAREAGSITNISQAVVLSDDADGCFAVVDDSSDEENRPYAYAQTADGSVIFADWTMLTNVGLYQSGTATLATWSLGRAETVIWFQPDFSLDPDTDGQLSPVQLPDWARMGIVWAVIVTTIGLLYIGRRNGPVITEPLPTEVSAAETTVGRGRIYAKAKHHRHALTILQQASLARLARMLRLGARAAPDAILSQTAAQLGRPVQELHRLYAPPSGELSSQEFVTRAGELQQLEQHVRERFAAPTHKESQ